MKDSKIKNTKVKVVLFGNPSSGKTTLFKYMTSGKFDDSICSTIGVSYATKHIKNEIENPSLHFEVWDTAGDKKYIDLVQNISQCMDCALIICDASDSNCLTHVYDWFGEIFRTSPRKIRTVLVRNKRDLDESIDKSIIQELITVAENQGLEYYETSAKTGEGIDELVEGITRTSISTQDIKNSSFRLKHSSKSKRNQCCC